MSLFGIKKKIWISVSSNKEITKVVPPSVSLMPLAVQYKEVLFCSRDNCRLMSVWFKGSLSLEDMSSHLEGYHLDAGLELGLASQYAL